MTTEKEQLEAEIAQRDARIAELEADIVYLKSVEKERNALRDELAALYAKPSAGVVLPEFIEHVKHARKELCRLEQSPWRIRQRLAQKLTDGIARINSSPVSTGVSLPEHRRQDLRSPTHGFAKGFNACLDEVSRLNPCRAQASGDSE